MATFNTNNALRLLLYEEEYLQYWLDAGYTKADRARTRHRFKNDQLSLDLIEEMLDKCGFKVAQEKKWNKPQKKL
ncbi:hypothetical protein [Spirosoma oryzicola]|uniref:hypothetical protein n=1 Tax=Spirosoma oryzicola TaxID=2898794 RepID=UPI001E60B30B|nr:hypothetical protein [Spirosoma oryzicola]UHG93441.1 hypothetical protein LQ777_11165 [Spirosoma oryzicola]